MRYMMAALLACGMIGCATPPANKRTDSVLRNTTLRPVEIMAKAGFFGSNIKLAPGETWKGWVPSGVKIQKIEIELADPMVKP